MWQDARLTKKIISVVLLYADDKTGWERNQKAITLHNCHKQCKKYLWVTLSKQVKDLYHKNIKSLKKELEEDIRK